MTGGWLKKALDEGHDLNTMGADICLYNFIQWGNGVDAQENLPVIWAENFPLNLKYWDEHPDKILGSAADMPKHEGKAVIFAGNGPSLMKAIDMFKERDDRFILVCANSALETLLKHDVVPDYVILIDGRKGHWTMDIDDDRCKDIVAIFSPAAEPETVSKWRGKCYVIPYKFEDETISAEVEKRWGNEYPTSGGNSINCAIALFVRFCLSTIYLIVGNELSWAGNYYADGRKHDLDIASRVITKNIYGEDVRTCVTHFEYKLWLENFIKALYPDFYFCNCSEGIVGVESDGKVWPLLDHKPLDLAIQDVKKAMDCEEKGVAYA